MKTGHREPQTAVAPSEPKEAVRRRLRKSKPRAPDWASGNAAKYFSYTEAWARITKAIKQGCFLEPVTIEESIVSDRLLSFLKKTCSLALAPSITRSLGRLTARWGEEFESRLADDPASLTASRVLRSRLDAWRERRNDVVHGLVKSTAARNEDHIDNFLAAAEESAIEGRIIAREISKWVEGHRRRSLRPEHP